jgi:hypothetical protein
VLILLLLHISDYGHKVLAFLCKVVARQVVALALRLALLPRDIPLPFGPGHAFRYDT